MLGGTLRILNYLLDKKVNATRLLKQVNDVIGHFVPWIGVNSEILELYSLTLILELIDSGYIEIVNKEVK